MQIISWRDGVIAPAIPRRHKLALGASSTDGRGTPELLAATCFIVSLMA